MNTRHTILARSPHVVWLESSSKFVVLAWVVETRTSSFSPLSAATKAETPEMRAPTAVGQRSTPRHDGRAT